MPNLPAHKQFSVLGTRTEYAGLDPIELGQGMSITFTSDEVTALCPVTGQPDWYTVEIFMRTSTSIESKSLKLYLGTFRDQGLFAELLAIEIADTVEECCKPEFGTVTVTQKSRGGITLRATKGMP
jgi:7-cyano-7-deazaguanine reductase